MQVKYPHMFFAVAFPKISSLYLSKIVLLDLCILWEIEHTEAVDDEVTIFSVGTLFFPFIWGQVWFHISTGS